MTATSETITTDTMVRSIDEGRQLFQSRYIELSSRAKAYFRDYKPEARDEAVANALCDTWENFVSLVERALANDRFLTSTFYFACKRTRSGRISGKIKSSGYKEIFNHANSHNSIDLDSFVSDRAGVFDVVSFKIDTEAWLESLTESQRHYATELAQGDGTKELAERHHVSPGAVSQRRAQLKASYERFMTV